jgi:preprotein translocase subunit SecE
VARDRKRAKQRRMRRGAATPGGGRDAARTLPSQPTRTDVPGALDHASGEVDEFDAALVRGADGVAATPDAPAAPLTEEPGDGAEDDQLERQLAEDSSGRGGDGDGGADGGDDGGSSGDGGAGAPGQGPAPGAPLQGGNRALAFLRASWAELQRVQWPDRRQVTQATAVVIGFVAIAGAYLGVADYVAKELVEIFL